MRHTAHDDTVATFVLCGLVMYPSLHVLIIDDDVVTVDSYRQMLQLEGFTVSAATNATDGLDIADRAQPDAIVVDLRMPLLNGVEFLRRLRSRATTAATPVAIVTGDYLLDESITTALRSLGATLRFKPLWLEDLVGLTRELLLESPVAACRPDAGVPAI